MLNLETIKAAAYPEMLENLTRLKSQNIAERMDNGICVSIRINKIFSELVDADTELSIVENLHTQIEFLVEDLFSGWEFHSGDKCYPVPASKSDLGKDSCTENASNMYWSETSCWEGEYGELRNDLLEYSIQKLTKLVEELRNQKC
ncbi:hypothetical protein KNT64_gp204 [Pseudomonas phage PspYZU05]|uniref:Uncharacterized protein n=1 Tax=Pseudomonas phage PspYZU05 TaxID=1983556 RepID=A0A2U7N577_9CAUD|nr:hypothetical protein KNT64_gp204 [Pseudomonas phage PspYZU05]ASD52156.1 hypothetical protein PspYZU05_204 [Pseudomonas phage PspYZU05]